MTSRYEHQEPQREAFFNRQFPSYQWHQCYCLQNTEWNERKERHMAITVNLRYTGKNGSARKFAEEMEKSGTVDAIRAEEGNIRYEYYVPLNDPETVLLIDAWESQEALDVHHASPMMAAIAALREKYDLHMTVERFISADGNAADEQFIRK